jgi:UDP-N-acetylmuramate dehydrogenase
MGHGYNIILSKSSYGDNELIVCLRSLYSSCCEVNGNTIISGAGVSLKRLCAISAQAGLTGLENLWGIPSSLGGAVVMNAGAFGSDIHSSITSVIAYDMLRDKIRVFGRNELGTGYRQSLFRVSEYVILYVEISLQSGDCDTISNRMREVGQIRKARFPHNYPNAGSVFKKPMEGKSAGQLIESIGLKNFKVGGAAVSSQHAGFFVNLENATGRHLIDLAVQVRNAVRNELGVELEMEQIVI